MEETVNTYLKGHKENSSVKGQSSAVKNILPLYYIDVRSLSK